MYGVDDNAPTLCSVIAQAPASTSSTSVRDPFRPVVSLLQELDTLACRPPGAGTSRRLAGHRGGVRITLRLNADVCGSPKATN